MQALPQLKNGVCSLFIDGQWVTAQNQQNPRIITNPATLEALAVVPQCGKEDVDAAVQAARRAHVAWAAIPGAEKANLLHEVARRLRARERDLSTLMTLETGKPLIESIDCIDWVAACFDYYAEVGRSSRGQSLPPVAPHQVNYTMKEPYGVVAAIAPFNFPLLLMSWKVAPALAAGNTIVCKPPHQNPLSSLLLAEIYAECLPPGVVNVVTGDGATGDLLINHSEVDLIAFTGSTKVGRHVAATAGAQLKKVNLELGGIDPLIVMSDADIEVAVRGAAWARLLNAGQVCTSSKRFYIVDAIREQFTKRLVEYVKTVQVGDPRQSTTDMGPLISAEALVTVERQVKALHEEGATLLCGGKRFTPGPGLKGHFFEPTIFTNVRHGGIATTEEIFGPVINIIAARDEAHAIELANDSKFGLGAVVYTKSLEWAMRAADSIKAGTFWINDPLTDNDAGPFGGMRWSGMGRELGEEGLDAFREPKHVHLDYVMERKNFWFPYADRPIHANPAGNK